MLKTRINGKWVPFSNNKVFLNGGWTTIKPTDKVYLNGKWHLVGEEEKPSFVNPALNTIRSNFMATCSFGGENDYGLCQVQTPLPSGDSLENSGLVTNNSLKIVNHTSSNSSSDFATFKVADFKTASSMLISFWITRTALDAQVCVISLGHGYTSNVQFSGLFLDCLSDGYNNRLRMQVCANNIIESNDQTLGIVNQPRHILLYLKPGSYFMAVDGVCKSSTYSGSFISTNSNAPYGPYVKFGGWGSNTTATYEGLMIWKDVNIDFTKFQELASLLYGEGQGRFPVDWNISTGVTDYTVRLNTTTNGVTTSKLLYWIPQSGQSATHKPYFAANDGTNISYLALPKVIDDLKANGYFIAEDLQQLQVLCKLMSSDKLGDMYVGDLYDPTTNKVYIQTSVDMSTKYPPATIVAVNVEYKDGDTTYTLEDVSGEAPVVPPKPTYGDYLYVSGFLGDYARLNGKYLLVDANSTGNDRIWRHTTENELIANCIDATDYWVIHYTTEDENIQPSNPGASDAYLYVDRVQDPYNEDGTSKSWANRTLSGTITVLHNRTE